MAGGSNRHLSTTITPLAYNPTSDSWRELPEPPLQRREQSASVWTGTEWAVWGGTTGQDELNDGIAYNPVTGTWRVIADSPLSPQHQTSMIYPLNFPFPDSGIRGELQWTRGRARRSWV